MNRIVYLGVLAILMSAAQPAFAWGTKKTVFCDKTLPDNEELTGEINANVVVKAGKHCHIDSAHITGNVTAQPGADELAIEGSYIQGSITTNFIEKFYIDQTTVTGSVTVKALEDYGEICNSDVLGKLNVSLTAGTLYVGDIDVYQDSPEVDTSVRCLGSRFGKAATVSTTTGSVYVDDNDFFETLTFKNNTGYEEVKRNDMESLLCKNNTPPVVTGGIDGNDHNDISKTGKDTCDPPELAKPVKK